MEIQFCLECKKLLKGRSDKKFCDQKCKNNHYNEFRRTRQPFRFRQINQILIHNRNILKSMFEKYPLKSLQKQELSQEGFLPSYFTHNSSDTYFCYDYGFRTVNEDHVELIRIREHISMSA